MKGILVLAMLLLTGCANYQSLEQLETHALVSGDWSKVEKRERIIAKRTQREATQCPRRLTKYCNLDFSSERCSCVDRDQLKALLNAY